MNNIENIQEYIPTVYVNDSEPDLDETNLNKTEQAIKRVTDAANKAIDALKQLDREKLALSAISNVLSDATDKVPSLALANTMQLAINDLNTNLANIQIGTIDINASANGITDFTVNFPKPFSSRPEVFLNVLTGQPNLRSAVAYSRLAESFTGKLYNGTTAGIVGVSWVAISK